MSAERELMALPGKEFILEHLQCPVCFQIPLPPIWICARGHTTCDDCRPQLRHCGLCRDNFTDTRNFFMEAIVMESTFSCPYRSSGCLEVSTGNVLKEHKYKCEYGPKVKWVPCTDNAVPENAVFGGFERSIKLYIIRSPHMGSITPGKRYAASPQGPPKAYICWGGAEHRKSEYEVLVAPLETLTWVPSSHGQQVPNAVVGGVSEDGEDLFIGRVIHDNNVVIGKIHRSHHCCYIPYGNEKAFDNYEILVEVSQD